MAEINKEVLLRIADLINEHGRRDVMAVCELLFNPQNDKTPEKEKGTLTKRMAKKYALIYDEMIARDIPMYKFIGVWNGEHPDNKISYGGFNRYVVWRREQDD